MAGRPKMTAQKVTELEERAVELALSMHELAPGAYCTPEPPADQLGKLWHTAWRTAFMANVAIQRLGDALRAKAGIAEPGPTAQARAALGDDALVQGAPAETTA